MSEEQLLLEWRESVIMKLTEMGLKIDSLNSKIQTLEISMATNSYHTAKISKLEDKVETLETFKTKFIGGMIALNGVLAVVGWLVNIAVK